MMQPFKLPLWRRLLNPFRRWGREFQALKERDLLCRARLSSLLSSSPKEGWEASIKKLLKELEAI